MPNRFDDRILLIDAALEHLRQVKAGTIKMVISLQKKRDRMASKKNRRSESKLGTHADDATTP